MGLSTLFAERAASDTTRIGRAATQAAIRVSTRLRGEVLKAYRKGERFPVGSFIREQLTEVLQMTLLAGHLAGFRRAFLIRSQLSAIQRARRNGKLSLSLRSGLEDALDVLQARTGLDLDALQKQYNTEALKTLNGVSQDVEQQLSDTITMLVADGAHVKEGIEAISAKFDALGISPRNGFQIETIFRTQLQLAFGAGKYQAEQDEALQEILWGYKYVTVGDDRVRETHAALDGVTLPKNDPFWLRFYPPNGYNCRCMAIPIFEERESVKPPSTLEDGTLVEPDKGFSFNPGEVFKAPVAHTMQLPKTVTQVASPEDTLRGTPEGAEQIGKRLDELQDKYSPEIQSLIKRGERMERKRQKALEDREKISDEFTRAFNALREKEDSYVRWRAVAKGELILEGMTPEASKELAKSILPTLEADMKPFEDAVNSARAKYREAVDAITRDYAEENRKWAFKELAQEKDKQTNWRASGDKAYVESTIQAKAKASPNEGYSLPSKELSDRADTVLKNLGPLLNNETWGSVGITGNNTIVIVGQLPPDGRAHCGWAGIYCSEKETPVVIAHEFGHVLEHVRRAEVSQKLHDFIKLRCGDEQPTQLKQIFPNNGYRETEYGRKDDFDKLAKAFAELEGRNPNSTSLGYYTGKTYEGFTTIPGSTEVLSMGLQYLYHDPILFAKTDPQYFSLVMGILRGEL